MHTPASILIVDDEASIRFSLGELLSRDAYEVVAAECGESALARLAAQPFDLVLLDLKMPGISGIEVLSAMREQGLDAAVIVLTAHGSMDTAITALRQGAHDYLLKPYDAATLRESVRTALLERERTKRQKALLLQVERDLTASLEEIRAAVVRPSSISEPATAGATFAEVPDLQHGGLVIDLAQHAITLDGCTLDVSPTEFDLLAYLAEQAPRVVDACELVREVQGYDCDRLEASDIVRHHIYRIRQKAEICSGRSDIIRTVRGVGYALNG